MKLSKERRKGNESRGEEVITFDATGRRKILHLKRQEVRKERWWRKGCQ